MERRRSFDGRRKPREKVYLDRTAVRERLDAVGLTTEEASERMGFSAKYLDRVLKSGRSVSKRARQALQRVLGRDLSATDVRATLPEGLARRGFPREEVIALQFPRQEDIVQAEEKHERLPGFVKRNQLPSPLREYFRFGYGRLNERLRLRQPLTSEQRRTIRQLLAKARPLQLDAPLYRGVFLEQQRNEAIAEQDEALRRFMGYEPSGALPQFKHQFTKGQELSLLSPVSTSPNLPAPLRFARTLGPDYEAPPAHTGSVLFELHGAEGNPAVVTNELEQEVLLAPGRKLRVLHVEPKVVIPRGSEWVRRRRGMDKSETLLDEWVVGELE